MGAKDRIGKVSNMRTLGVLLFAGSFVSSFALALPRAEIPIRKTLLTSPAPLTTEKVWEIDPFELAPHRRVWAVERKIQFQGLRAERDASTGSFSARVDSLEALTTLWIRQHGAYSEAEFPCGQKKPKGDFWLVQGAEEAARWAADVWQRELNDATVVVSVRLKNAKFSTEEETLASAQILLREWLREAEVRWGKKVFPFAREREWNAYIKAGFPNRKCTARNQATAGRFEDRMDPLQGEVPKKHAARAPAKLWNGAFTIRGVFDHSGKRLNGQLLLDPAAANSGVSGLWLRNQGILPASIVSFEQAPLLLLWRGKKIWTPTIDWDLFQIGNLPIPVVRFGIFVNDESLKYSPPAFVGDCCDGVLGLDFFRRHVVEFQGFEPSAVQIWQRQGFRQDLETPWTEVQVDSEYRLKSSCTLHNEKQVTPVQVFWNFFEGDTESTNHAKFEKAFLRCGFSEWDLSKHPIFKRSAGVYTVSPKAWIGGSVFVDLPHGRIWFDKNVFGKVFPVNRSGVVLKYHLDRIGDRVLRVERLQKKIEGLKVGMEIVKVNGKDVAEFDQWQVDRILAGERGPELTLEWKTPKGQKILPLTL